MIKLKTGIKYKRDNNALLNNNVAITWKNNQLH